MDSERQPHHAKRHVPISRSAAHQNPRWIWRLCFELVKKRKQPQRKERDKVHYIESMGDSKLYLNVTKIGEQDEGMKYIDAHLVGHKIYGIPYNAENVLIIDTKSDTVDTTTIQGIAGFSKYSCAVPAPYWKGSKLYAIPSDATNVMIVDTTTDTADITSIKGIKPGKSGKNTGFSYADATAVENKIIAVPQDADEVLAIDTEVDMAEVILGSSRLAGSGKYSSIVTVGDKAYGLPFHSAQNIMIYDADTHKVDTTTLKGFSGQAKYVKAVVIRERYIYAIPSHADHVLILDTATNKFDNTTIKIPKDADCDCSKYQAVVTVGHKIYAFPYSASHVLIINTLDNTADVTSISGLTGKFKYVSAVAVGTKIFALPAEADHVMIVDTTTDVEDIKTIARLDGPYKFRKAVLAGSKIYGVPFNSPHVLVIDTSSLGKDSNPHSEL